MNNKNLTEFKFVHKIGYDYQADFLTKAIALDENENETDEVYALYAIDLWDYSEINIDIYLPKKKFKIKHLTHIIYVDLTKASDRQVFIECSQCFLEE